MKKFYPLCVLLSVLAIGSYLLWSCSSSDEGNTPGPVAPENSFAYGDVESKIQSVVYTVDDQKAYTFYFSPTQGLVDLDAMLMADDYIKIVTNTPTGTVDLLAANNSLIYKNVNVSSSSADNVTKATLSLQLTSLSTVKISLDAAMKSGETLRAEYNGTCIKQQGEDPGDVYDVTLTDQIFGYYMGTAEKTDAGTNGYYLAVTNAQWQGGGTEFNLTSEGYALVLNFYGNPGETWRDMPTGTFSESGQAGDHTFDSEYSAVLYKDDKGQMQLFQLIDPVKIERDEAGVATITASFLDKNYNEYTLIYKNNLKIINASLGYMLPQIDRDMVIDGAYASGVYSGDVANNGTGLVEITIIDRKGENSEPNGSAMKIALFGPKFDNPKKERHLTPGTYTVGIDNAQGTWAQVIEGNFMGMIYPQGTYAAYDDGTQQGLYSYAESGDIVIRAGNNNTYTIEFDLVSIEGYSIQGSFTGDVFLEDASNDDKNDGSTNLEDNYEMDLSYVLRGNCFPQDEIYIPGLGTVPVSTACEHSGIEYGYQYIQLGGITYEPSDEYPVIGKLLETDIMGIELLVMKGMEDKVTPGVYSVTLNRYPARFRPGVCVRGYISPSGIDGTALNRVESAIGWGYPEGYFDPTYTVAEGWLNVPTINKYAAIYGGTITVTKADGGDNWFTFKIDGKDVLKHDVTSTWTGPVYLGNTDTPATQSASAVKAETAAKAAAIWDTPSYRELKFRSAQQNSTVRRQSYK